MSQESRAEAEQNPQNYPSDGDHTTIFAESGIIIRNHHVQSIEILDKFTRNKTSDGGDIALHHPCKVTINLTTSMRKLEILLVEGDIIGSDGGD